MKYGIKECPFENDEKSSSEQTASEIKVGESAGESVTAVEPNENKFEPSNVTQILHKNEAPESEKCTSNSDNEPVVTTDIVPSLPLVKSETCEVQTILIGPIAPIPIRTEIPAPIPQINLIQTFDVTPKQVELETVAMVCDVTGTEIPTTQETLMEVIYNDEESAEVEMVSVSKPSTPNDIDMFDNLTDRTTDAPVPYTKCSVNYNFKNAPIVELSRYSWGMNEQKYLRGCTFSPDGTCILTTVNKDGMHIVELPLSLYENESVATDRSLDILTSAVHVPEGGTVYDYQWYPFMNSTLPETCCFISTRQHEPLQLWDAFDGKLRCTYRGYDAVDEVESALSVCFSIDGSQVIAGYKKTLKIFRTDVPGRDYTNFAIKSPAASLAINQSDANMIAIGSWNSFVTFHDVRSPKLIVTEKLVKHTGGVTLMKFSSDGNRLITGARKDNKLLGWDVRNVTEPLFSLNRCVETNQKIYFDLNWSDQWLVSGDTNGCLHAYDIKYGLETGKFPDYQYQLHRDCCNGVSLHPTRPIFATASGQHHFIGIDEDIALKSAKVQENSLIFWWYGDTD